MEDEAQRRGCCRVMACVADVRRSVVDWFERRGYFIGARIPYPSSLGHRLLSEDTCLLALLKPIDSPADDRVPDHGIYPNKRPMSLPPLWRLSGEQLSGSAVLDVD